MSELINNAKKRRDLLKHMMQELHKGESPEAVRSQLARLLGEVPYHEVVAVEQELIAEGMPTKEILSFCDMHSAALRGKIDQSILWTEQNRPGRAIRLELVYQVL